jgi:hypothetical protein
MDETALIEWLREKANQQAGAAETLLPYPSGQSCADTAAALQQAADLIESISYKLEPFQKRVTDLGYDDLDALLIVFERNIKWLDAIQTALKRYRVSLTKTEAEAFRDLTSAIEEPPHG